MKLKVSVRTREEFLFDGWAASVTSRNDQGNFDVLPGHTNFISLLKDYLVVRPFAAPPEAEQRWEIKGEAVLRVFSDRVEIFLEVATPLSSSV